MATTRTGEDTTKPCTGRLTSAGAGRAANRIVIGCEDGVGPQRDSTADQ